MSLSRRTLGLMRSLHDTTDETIDLAEPHHVRYTTRIGEGQGTL